MSLELILSPAGHILAEASAEAEPKLSQSAVSRLEKAFGASTAEGLELLAGDFLHENLPPTAAFWRDFARQYFTRLCHSKLIVHVGQVCH